MAVRQIENLLELLAFFEERQRPATLADVVSHFDWPRSSAFNILSTLSDKGYLYEPRARAGYYPTPRWSQLAAAFAQGEPISERLLRVIADLAAETSETVFISGPSGLHAVFLEVIESPASVRYAAKPGNRVPIHATASGHALLSQYPKNDLDILLRKVRYERFGSGTPTSSKEVLSQIEAGRRRGWFQSASHYSPDLGGVSVPVIEGSRVFGVTIAGPLFRVAAKAKHHSILLHQAINRIYGEDYSRRTLVDFDPPSQI